tara:strand:+ start:807 stop:1535 length:729 start_codon:yes stop_codon:yes gene_type:complete
MGSLVNKSPSETYKSLLKVADETNGVSTSISKIEDGEGTESCVSIGTRSLQVTPTNNTTTTFSVNTETDGTIFNVDTSNNNVNVGVSQVNATTQLLEFSAYRLVPSGAGTHMFVPQGTTEFAGHYPEVSNGTGTDPDTTKDAGSETDNYVTFLFPVPYNMTIDAVKVLISTDTTTDTVCNVHLMSYDMVNDGTTNDGNLTNGTVLADGQATAVDRAVIKTIDCTIQSSSVTSGKVIACCCRK